MPSIQKNYTCQHPDGLEAASAWSGSADACDLCGDRSFKPLCRTAVENVCGACAVKILRTIARKAELAAWHYTRIHNALAAHGTLQTRLTVLWRYKEAESLFVKQPSSDVTKLRKLLVANLGFITQHPLADVVRQAAYEACVSTGKDVLPFLMARQNIKKPWKLYANIVLSAGTIAPDNPHVRNLLEKAAQHANPNVRGRVASAIMTHDSPWANKLLKRLKDDPNPRVREFIAAENRQMPLFRKKDPYPKKTRSETFKSKEHERNKALESAQGQVIVKVVEDCYTKSVLKTIYNTYLHSFYKPDDFDEVNLTPGGGFTVNKLVKTKLVQAFAYILADKEMLADLMSQMPSGVKTVLDTLVWEGGEHLAQSFDKDIKPPMITYKKEKGFGPHVRKVGYLSKAYQLFPYHSKYHFAGVNITYDYYLFLPDELRKVFKTLLAPPSEYHLKATLTVEKTDFIYEDRDRILRRIELFCAYIDQDNLKYAKNGEKVLKTSIKQMAKYCDILEFYNPKDKELGFLKTPLIIDFLQHYKKYAQNASAKSDSALFLKQVFSAFFKDTPEYSGYYLNRMLSHLKGIHNIKSGYYEQDHRKNEHTVRESLSTALKKLPTDKWTQVSDLIKYCRYRDIDLRIADPYFASRYLTFDQEMDSSGVYRPVSIGSSIYNDAVTTPLLKGALFLFASFGIVDIAYDYPKNDKLRKRKMNYLSVYDGLRHIRLTQLGAYIVGLTDTYKSAVEKQSAKIIPDENRLLIRLEGQDRLKAMILDKLSEKVSANCYKVTFRSFLKECTCKKDIHAKIKLFKEQIASDPPPLWQNFLNDIVKKIDPLKPLPDMRIYRLSDLNINDGQELITLMARDAVLKKYILKAEDYHIAVRTANLVKVKKRLEEFGYFITQLK